MNDQATRPVPQAEAHWAGFLYIIIIVAAAAAEMFIRGSMIVSGDAAATARNILASELQYREALGIDLVVLFCDTVVAGLLYVVLKPAGATLSLLAAAFRLVFVAIMGANALTTFAPLLLLKGGGALDAFTGAQLQGLALASLSLHDIGFNIALVFFGVHCVLLGALVARSGLLPRVVGVLMGVAGACYIVNSVNNFLPRELALPLFPYILLPGLLAESMLALWLFLVGVNAQRWNALTGAPGST